LGGGLYLNGIVCGMSTVISGSHDVDTEDAEGPGMNVRASLWITFGFCVSLVTVSLLSTTAPPVSAFSGRDGSPENIFWTWEHAL